MTSTSDLAGYEQERYLDYYRELESSEYYIQRYGIYDPREEVDRMFSSSNGTKKTYRDLLKSIWSTRSEQIRVRSARVYRYSYRQLVHYTNQAGEHAWRVGGLYIMMK